MTQNVKRNTIGRLALGFFAAMLVLTLLNQKIDALRTPTVATVLEQNESWTAVSGLSGDAPVVQYATRALNADGGPVRLWEGTA